MLYTKRENEIRKRLWGKSPATELGWFRCSELNKPGPRCPWKQHKTHIAFTGSLSPSSDKHKQASPVWAACGRRENPLGRSAALAHPGWEPQGQPANQKFILQGVEHQSVCCASMESWVQIPEPMSNTRHGCVHACHPRAQDRGSLWLAVYWASSTKFSEIPGLNGIRQTVIEQATQSPPLPLCMYSSVSV